MEELIGILISLFILSVIGIFVFSEIVFARSSKDEVDLFEKIFEELGNTNEWAFDGYNLWHRKRSWLKLWLRNGFLYFCICNKEELSMSLIWKLRLYRKANRLMEKIIKEDQARELRKDLE